MTPDEKRLIEGLFDRMRGHELAEKDREAEALINQSVRSIPDAPYMLVQSVLVQEQALEAASNRVQELEERVRALEESGARPKESSGSFLGGLLGGSARSTGQRPMSVPAIGSRSPTQPWAASGAQSQPQPQPQGGGFLRSAMTTAAGVAGGMLLAEGIRNMMGGSHAAHAGTAGSSAGTGANTAGESGGRDDAAREGDSPAQDANYDSGFDSGDWGDGLDI